MKTITANRNREMEAGEKDKERFKNQGKSIFSGLRVCCITYEVQLYLN